MRESSSLLFIYILLLWTQRKVTIIKTSQLFHRLSLSLSLAPPPVSLPWPSPICLRVKEVARIRSLPRLCRVILPPRWWGRRSSIIPSVTRLTASTPYSPPRLLVLVEEIFYSLLFIYLKVLVKIEGSNRVIFCSRHRVFLIFIFAKTFNK